MEIQVAFRGRPSKGCNKCRQRKVKCDELHPFCERCVKSGFECVYRDEFDVLLRNQTSETAVKAQKKWRSRAKKADEHTPSSSSTGSHTSPSSGSSASPPASSDYGTLDTSLQQPKSPEQALYDLANQRFMYDFVIEDTPSTRNSGFAGFVPKLLEKTKPGSCFWHAAQAVALANFSGRLSWPDATTLGSKEYGKAIALLGAAVADPKFSSPLETLGAISLLGIYELQSSPHLTHNGSWQAHVNGACAILNNVYAREGDNLEIGRLFVHITVQMLINKMSWGQSPSIPMSTIDKFVKPKTMASMLLGHMYRTAEALAEWRLVELDYGGDEATLAVAARKMVEQCDILDGEMVQWLADRAPIWKQYSKPNIAEHMPVWLQGLYTAPGAPTELFYYNEFWIGHRWGMMRSTRLQMHQHTLNAVDILISAAATDDELAHWLATQNRLEARLLTLINDALSAVYAHFTLPLHGKPTPKTIQDVASLNAFASLWVVYRIGMCFKRDSLAALDVEGRKGWVREVLCFMRDEMGFRKCVAFVDNIDGKYGSAYP